MTETSWVWQGSTALGALGDAGPYSSTDWQELYKTHFGTGANFANRGVIRGVDNTLEVTANSPAAKNVLVLSGAAFVQGIPYYNSGTETVTVADNASGSTRNDVIVLEADYTAQTVRIDIVQGTPAAGVPALTQTIGSIYQIPLAYLTLASGFASVTASMITDFREYANIPDAVGYLATNSSGGTLENGTVTVPTGTQSFTTSAVTTEAVGILERRTSNGAVGRIITHGIFSVICQASVSAGDYIGVGTVAGQAIANGAALIGRVLVANSGAGTRALCYVNIGMNRMAASCKIYNNANINVGAGGIVTFNSEYHDNNAMHSTSANTGRITFNIPGVYIYSFASAVSAATRLTVRLNGATIITDYVSPPVLGGVFAANFTDQRAFSASDYIEIIDNTGVNFLYSAESGVNFSATRISAP